MKSKRRLVAIMFTDIQGYSKLMQQSERAGVEIRERHREIFNDVTLAFEGEIIQYYGDGTLSIFNSSVNAVQCAAALQAAFQEPPAIPVRVGIHTGDVILAEDDIIGDSVNLASRIESLGIPGSVLVSGKVADEIRSHPDLPLKSLGTYHLKNDRHKREVFALSLPGLTIPDPRSIRGKLEVNVSFWRNPRVLVVLLALVLGLAIANSFLGGWDSLFASAGEIHKLAVLPFSDPTDDGSQDHIIEGVHESIISELHRAGIDVVPRVSMLGYRESDKGIRAIARELDVDALIQGTILRHGDSLNIDLFLIRDNGAGGDIIWDRSFPTEVKDLFLLYRDVTRAIAEEVELALSPKVEQRLAATAREVNGEAMELYLRGRQHAAQGPIQDVDKSIEFYQKALDVDPEFGPAYTGLVEAYLLKGFGALDPFEARTRFRLYAQKALELDPAIADAHQLKSMIHIFSELDWEAAEAELKRALAEGSPSPDLLDTYCQFLWALGRNPESVEMGQRAIAAGPDHHFAHCDLAWAYYYNGQIEAAKDMASLTRARFGDQCPFHWGLDIRLRLLEARDSLQLAGILEEISERGGLYPFDYYSIGFRAKVLSRMGRWDEARRVVEEAEENSSKIFISPTSLASAYLTLGDKDKAFEKLDQAFQQRSFILMYTLRSDPDYYSIRTDPRYQDLLRRMDLPVPVD